MESENRIRDHLHFLYGPASGEEAWTELRRRLEAFRRRNPPSGAPTTGAPWTERDAFLITYGDQIHEPGRPPLRTLAGFLEQHLGDVLGGIHLLPHFPYSSDDGFSVIDYHRVDPQLGDWEDVARLGRRFRLMLDGVVNHISWQSPWFQGFLRDEAPYNGYFIVCDPSQDLSRVVRPRTSPLLTPIETIKGLKHVWTTFSEDQMDLDYRNPRVLLEIVDVLLFYVERGATVIRLDAIAYLWKEIGTPCVHLPQTHRVVKLFRAVMDTVAPAVLLITETNVLHTDNINYFGDGTDEARMVYNFALPPLVIHTLRSGGAAALTQWAATLRAPSAATTFFNFTASHDGIGVMPARGLLSERQIEALARDAQEHGGWISHKTNADGSQSPYEMNITLFDVLNDPGAPDPDLDVRRFLASQVIMLSLAGVPGIYVHSLFGSRNWHEGVVLTGRRRTINRRKFQRADLEAELADPSSRKHRVFKEYRALLRTRASHPSFHPGASQRILMIGDPFFACVRAALDGRETIVTLVNVTSRPQRFTLSLSASQLPAVVAWHDLIGGVTFRSCKGRLPLTLEPYQSVWLVNSA